MTENNFKILIATKNSGKIQELEKMLTNLPFQLLSLKDFPNVFEPAETGETFAENAALKAKSYAVQTGTWALADDSGLEVEALNNAPGVFSARYAGENATDQIRIKKLLEEIELTSDSNRRARFGCSVALADEKGAIKFIEEGICNGHIAFSPAGTNGFGYDPIFIPDNFSQTFGELSAEIKQQLSHRAQAINKIIQRLRRFQDLLT